MRNNPAIRRAPQTWQKWLSVCESIEDPDVEFLDAEEFAGFSGLFDTLLRLGVPFDTGFVAQVRQLQERLINTDADPHFDGFDHGLTDDESGVDHHWELEAQRDEYGSELANGFNPSRGYRLQRLPKTHWHPSTRVASQIAVDYTKCGMHLKTGDQVAPPDHHFPHYDQQAAPTYHRVKQQCNERCGNCRRIIADARPATPCAPKGGRK